MLIYYYLWVLSVLHSFTWVCQSPKYYLAVFENIIAHFGEMSSWCTVHLVGLRTGLLEKRYWLRQCPKYYLAVYENIIAPLISLRCQVDIPCTLQDYVHVRLKRGIDWADNHIAGYTRAVYPSSRLMFAFRQISKPAIKATTCVPTLIWYVYPGTNITYGVCITQYFMSIISTAARPLQGQIRPLPVRIPFPAGLLLIPPQ